MNSESSGNENVSQDDEMNGKKNSPESSASVSNSNASSVSNNSTVDLSALPITTSTEHEQSLENDIERKLLRKMQCHLMEIFQHLNETLEPETNSTKTNLDESNFESHKISSSTTISSVADEEIGNEPGPSQ